MGIQSYIALNRDQTQTITIVEIPCMSILRLHGVPCIIQCCSRTERRASSQLFAQGQYCSFYLKGATFGRGLCGSSVIRNHLRHYRFALGEGGAKNCLPCYAEDVRRQNILDDDKVNHSFVIWFVVAFELPANLQARSQTKPHHFTHKDGHFHMYRQSCNCRGCHKQICRCRYTHERYSFQASCKYHSKRGFNGIYT